MRPYTSIKCLEWKKANEVDTPLSLIGWLLSNVGTASELKTFGAIIGVGVITTSALLVLLAVIGAFAYMVYDAGHQKR
ncbi:MAG: hypothetical protein L3J28_04980 [Candidatus Polarisedimenticolaceae bacterium]|nr:hypothetical protein [Candidatus Polarisedimenticolaceae bacterium]